MSYSRVLATYPYIVLGLVTVFSLTCLVVIFTAAPTPDFSDPKLGFETRGTELSNRMHTFEQLLDKTNTDFSLSKKYTVHTVSSALQQTSQTTKDNKTRNNKFDVVRVNALDGGDGEEDEEEEDGAYYETSGGGGTNGHGRKDRFFCDMPRVEYARVIVTSVDEHPLYNVTKLHAMCRLERDAVRALPEFGTICVRETLSGSCCRAWSVGAYIAQLRGRASCEETSDEDVRIVRDLLEECVGYYHSGALTPHCWSFEEEEDQGSSHGPHEGQDSGLCADNTPTQCKRYNAIYNILHYLTDIKFMSKVPRGLSRSLEYSAVFLPLARSLASDELYKAMDQQSQLTNEEVQIVAVDFGLKQQLFEFYLKKDMVWLFLSMLIVWLAMWIYTASLFLTFMTMASITFSLIISYVIYTLVFKIEFFPFMNLLAIVILLGVGTDDVFIYSRVWTMSKREKNVGTLEKVISDTLKHAALSMFVTSLTTACAFYANYVSNITALKCFGLFTGTAILVNFAMMLTWIPAAIIIQDKWCSDCCLCYSYDSLAHRHGSVYSVLKVPAKFYHIIQDWTRVFFEKILGCLVIKLRILWILIFGGLGACSIVIVLFTPKMKLPTSDQFQVFAESHPFEVYDIQMRDQFWFEKMYADNTGTMPITIVFGVKAVDNGNHLNPFSEGTLELDEDFSMSTPEAQSWLRSFCSTIRSLNFYQPENGPQLSNCFIENFKQFMQRECKGMRGENLEPCCASSSFPYPEDIFDRCLALWIPMLTQSKKIYPSTNRIAGPRYSTETGERQALVVEFHSKVPFSFNYNNIGEFYTTIDDMVKKELLENAPPEMKGAWFTSHFDFYDLQHSISSGTPFAIGVSLAIATIVAFLTTLNVLVTLYAMASISLSIFTTVAALILLGWELNILESVTISVAVGLSIDFTLHYGMAYRLAPDLDKAMRINCATSRQGAPITMAALTTFLAGAMMMPSTILAYRQLGTFLMLVMLISWLYSNFFFLSLLKTVGPEGGFGQFHWPSCYCSLGGDDEHVDKTVYTMSDSNISRANSTEMHELEPLADRSPIVSVGRVEVKESKEEHIGGSIGGNSFSVSNSNSMKRLSDASSKHTVSLSHHSAENSSVSLSNNHDEGCIECNEEEEEEEEQEHCTLLSKENGEMEPMVENGGSNGPVTVGGAPGAIWLKKVNSL